ncbi:glutamate-gated kainate-type ion channel receptor subunit GluR5 [Senna tora]|uniref:Glutamate-gated kainate-type ion channel receptor subunit GluR5 n=1 Tax=Senna tora TaxID=362788 RepID=A0A834TG21_9FABA|nr:glutamate-gated kainate-type ion channel receptor subunit GluR5 [Senna tora]
MLGSWRHNCLIFTLLAFVVLSEGTRLPKEYWEQMLPKKLPSPSSSPSRGTNSASTMSSTTLRTDSLPSSDGKV